MHQDLLVHQYKTRSVTNRSHTWGSLPSSMVAPASALMVVPGEVAHLNTLKALPGQPLPAPHSLQDAFLCLWDLSLGTTPS